MKEILLVDDKIDIQVILADFLRNIGIKVDACENGAEAIKKLEKKTYDLIVTDLMMPKEDGFSLVYKVQNTLKSTQKTPIIVMTGGNSSEKFKLNMEYLAKTDIKILKKPFSRKEFEDAVLKAMKAKPEDLLADALTV